MAYEQEAKYVSNESAIRVSFSEANLIGDKTLVRRWEFGRPELMSSVHAYLNTILTVQDPIADKKVYPGLWRVASVSGAGVIGTRENNVGPFQSLAFGYATVIDWKEARLVKGDNWQPLGAPAFKDLTVQWMNCARDSVNAMAASLLALPSFSPLIVRGETYSGTWYNSGVTPSIAPDGSGVITLQLSQQYRDLSYTEAITGDVQTDIHKQLGLTTETPDTVTAPIAGGTLANHAIERQQISPNSDNSKNVETTKQTPIAVSVPEFIARINSAETEYELEERHHILPPNITLPALGTSLAILAHNLDEFLTHNYKQTRTVRKYPLTDAENAGGITWPIYGDLETISIQAMQSAGGNTDPNVKYVKTVYIYQTIYYYTMKYFNNATDAAAFASLVDTSALPSDPNQNGVSSGINTQYDNNYRSHFGHAGLDMWEATRILIVHSLRYTRQYDDPSAP
jgi:hypothetical protein